MHLVFSFTISVALQNPLFQDFRYTSRPRRILTVECFLSPQLSEKLSFSIWESQNEISNLEMLLFEMLNEVVDWF